MKTHRSSAKVAGALAVAAAIAFTASTASSQAIDEPDANLPAVQADDDTEFDARVEVQLAPRAERALAEGGGWEALARGLELRYDGERPMESEVRVALVTRDGRVLDSRVLDSTTLERGDSPLRAKQIVFSQAEDLVPVKAYAGEKHKPRGPGVFDENARIPVPNITRAEERGVGVQPGRVDERGVMPGDNAGRFLVVTVVPIDARFDPDVQPLIVDLDAKGQTGDPLLAPDDKPDW